MNFRFVKGYSGWVAIWVYSGFLKSEEGFKETANLPLEAERNSGICGWDLKWRAFLEDGAPYYGISPGRKCQKVVKLS